MTDQHPAVEARRSPRANSSGPGPALHALKTVALFLAVSLAFLASVPASPAQAEGAARGEGRPVLVGLEPGNGRSLRETARELEAQIASGGGSITHRYRLIDAVSARLDDQQIERLRGDPGVRYVVADGRVATPERLAGGEPRIGKQRRISAKATPAELYPWGVERIRAPAVHRARRSAAGVGIVVIVALVLLGNFGWRRGAMRGLFVALTAIGTLPLAGCSWVVAPPPAGVTGANVEVALLDTGVDLDHPDFRKAIAGGIDLINGDGEPQDDNGHGTGVAGVLAARRDGQGLIGVAPQVRIWFVKMLRHDEQGTISDLIRGIEWAVSREVEIINMSLGTDEDNAALREAIRAAYQAGVLLVAAAGNQGDRVLYPGAYPEVIAVAATNRSNGQAWFSNAGPEVELAAPGVELLTTGLQGSYQVRSGTSFAVPHVSGTAALLFSAGLRDVQTVRRRLVQTAEDLGLAVSAQGHGLVNAERAILEHR